MLRKHRERNNETTAVAKQRPARNNGSTVVSGVFYVVHFEAVSRDRPVVRLGCSQAYDRSSDYAAVVA
jgi:hypothetical protein